MRLCFIYELLRGCCRASPLARCQGLLGDPHKQGRVQMTHKVRVRNRVKKQWTKVGVEEDKERWEGGGEGEGHEVRLKRSDLTAGEYSSLQKSHGGLTQPLNTRHVSRCATHKHTHSSTHRHTPPKRSLSLSPLRSYTCKLYTLHAVIGISLKFATF